jgi:2'-5' RNA ligase/SAM-dependent methyltransferase
MPKADPSVALAQKALELCDDCEPGDVDCEETCVEKTLALKSGATTVRKMAAGMPAPSGVMVALRMPKTVADAIAIPGGEKAEDLHVTVAYIPKIGADEAKRMLIQEALAPLAQTLAPIKGCIGGIGVFNASESSGNRRVFYATFSSPGLEKLRAAVLDALAKVGVEPANKHGFVPHITLKYLDEKEGIPGQPVAMPDFPVDGLCIGWAEGAVELELNGVVVLKAGEPVKLDLGCGDARAPGHIGIDLAPQDEATLMHDLEAGIPMPDASVDEIRAHDLLHHMADPEHLMGEADRVLKPGGLLSYEGPDALEAPEGYTEESAETEARKDADGKDQSWNKQVFRKGDPATSDDASPRDPAPGADAPLPADAQLALDAVGYGRPDGRSAARGNEHFGYPSAGGQPTDSVAKREGLIARIRKAVAGFLSEREVEQLVKKAMAGAEKMPPAAQPDPHLSSKDHLARLDRMVQKAASDFHAAPTLPNRAALYDAVLARDSAERVLKLDLGMEEGHSSVVRVMKADKERQIVYGVVLEPDTEDSQGDVISADDIEKTAHDYLIDSRVVGSGHTKAIKAHPVESYLAPVDFEVEGPHGKQTVKKGSWVLAAKITDPQEWDKIKKGDYTGWSVGGVGQRDPM